jgi:hypothetical protein
MENNILKKTKISEYLRLLKDGTDIERIQEIDSLLSAKIVGVSGGFDLALFQLQKDLLLFQCKYLLAMFDFDQKKVDLYAKKIEDTRLALKKKEKKAEKSDPYSSFLQWLLMLKKYYGSDIDKDNDLMYLVEATNSMMKWYGSQNEQIEQQKQKQKRK